ncbi:uncharacterized protein KY384_006042 [Bacidia gigantensis]|uniref:uncharacterized protein n=1 Tax=Bacidia gigantensis TaxID=2732470 RepID=UPI001D058472|nr:uncharacterized protein KY384_006042 [Bacidia gigantensis]KAG8529405.1 hypothetical protein KY384_006042 [Bacidia gigantensis]
MALVARPLVTTESQSKLMARSRIQLPPLPFETGFHRQLATPLAVEAATNPLKRKHPLEADLQYAPRYSRKTFTFSSDTSSDMETYHGHVRTPADAIILFEACRLGLLPRVQRRLSEKERQSIKSGSVFVWDEREAGMRRWTDGKSWSASRVSGSFLTYREMEGKRGGGGNGYPPPVTALARAGRTPESTHGSESDIDLAGEEGPDGYRYKPDGLVKQSFSITTSSGNHLHLISYYSRTHPASQQLNSPSTDPQLRHIRPAKGMYPESTVHEHQNIPAVTRSPMAGAPYTTTPQMAGYARQGPPQWPQQQNYGWNQPPPSHPQYQYQGYSYGPHSYAAPPPGQANGQSSLQYSQSAQYSASQSGDRPPPAYDQRPSQPQPHLQYQGYDTRRYPPTPPDSRPSQNQNMQTNSPDARQRPIPNYQHPSPYPPGIREAYPGPAHDQRYQRPPPSEHPPTLSRSQPSSTPTAQQNAPQPQAYPPGPLPPPQPNRSTPPSQYQQQPAPNASTPIDPQLTGVASVPHQRNGPPSEPAGSMPGTLGGESRSRGTVQPNGYHPSPASSIPSINSLVNGSTPQNPSENRMPVVPNGAIPNGLSSYLQKPERKSPPEAPNGKEGLPDIASSKSGLTEDKRAINILDRGFKV